MWGGGGVWGGGGGYRKAGAVYFPVRLALAVRPFKMVFFFVSTNENLPLAVARALAWTFEASPVWEGLMQSLICLHL